MIEQRRHQVRGKYLAVPCRCDIDGFGERPEPIRERAELWFLKRLREDEVGEFFLRLDVALVHRHDGAVEAMSDVGRSVAALGDIAGEPPTGSKGSRRVEIELERKERANLGR